MEIDPKEANAFNALSLVEAAGKDLVRAELNINQALDLKPGDSWFLNNRGYIRLLKGELQLAVVDINQSIASDPRNAWAYRNKGIYYLMLHDAPLAVRLLRQAAEMDPFVENIYSYLAEAYHLAGDRIEACKALKESKQRGEKRQTAQVQCAQDL
ncbi:hypothetical protein QQ054_26020 [Oscillatoria amoena NRMC-F 0135]|nr:hypothetical protein [Oscillatoria amoena NRMC-F 0135]